MSRRKKRTRNHTPGGNHHSSGDPATRKLSSPRPNVAFLTATILLLVAWIALLVMLAVAT